MTDGEGGWPLGDRLRAARGTEPIKALAARAGVGPETYWQLENGRRRDDQPFRVSKPPIVLAVARALRIPEEEALELAGYEPWRYITQADDGGSPLASPEEFAKSVAQLPTDMQRALQAIVEVYLRDRGSARPANSPMVVKPGPAEAPHSGARFGPEEPPLSDQPQGDRVKSDS